MDGQRFGWGRRHKGAQRVAQGAPPLAPLAAATGPEPLTPEAVETAAVPGGPTPWPCPLCAVESGEPVLPAYGASITDLTCSRGAGSDESIGHSPVPAQGNAAAPDELGDRDLSFFHSNGPGSLHATRPRSYQWGNGWGPPGRPLDGTFHTRGRCSRPLFRCAHLMATW